VSELTAIGGPRAPLGEGGVLVDRYRLRGLLGRGGMAEVYLAQDDVLGRPVAVKVFQSGPASLGEAQRQRHEAQLLASLNHPGLVTVFDAGVDANRHQAFLVMEIVRGPTLAARLADGPLPEGEVREIGACLAEALAYVHAHGVVHRDVKPGNVLFTDPDHYGAVKLADFGIARMADSASHTDAGLVVGSARYLSPEQALGAGAGPPTDVYALGLVLLECLTGAPAYPGAGIAAAVARLHRDPQLPDHLDPALRRLLTAMTSREPPLRPTAHEVAAMVTRGSSTRLLPSVEALTDPEKAAGQPLAAMLAGRVGRVHRAWLAAACAAVVVALAGSAALREQSATGTETATVAPPASATVDAVQVPPATPTTPSASPRPAVQSEASAVQVANDGGGEEGQEETNNQRNSNDNSKDKDKDKDKGKDKDDR
jgi:eukaryotic-like serine/threonine-protein kinase